MAGAYLDHDSTLEPAPDIMSDMLDVRGTVQATVDGNLGLGAELQDGRIVLGQHALTGKEVSAPASPIRRLFIT